jgi:anaerobic selenocysteine-containing dehydrogenase
MKTDTPMRVVHAVCSLDCPDSCGVSVTVDPVSGRAVKVQGDPAHPVTRGFLCGKVAKMLDRVYAPDRLLYPMRRKPGVPKGSLPAGREAEAFERVSWDEALTGIAAKLTGIAQEFGPESVLPYSYAGTIGQLGYGSMDRRFFHRMGASQLDRTICSSAGGAALTSVYGIRLGTQPQDYAKAGLVIAWGANIHGNNIHLWPFIEEARRAGARLVAIDPYRTRTAALADEHMAIRPGTDSLLALGLMHVLFREHLEDAAYLAECVNEWEALRDHALRPEHAPEAVAGITGIAAERIVALARDYATCFARTGKGAVIRLNYGVQRSENGGTAARAVAMLPLAIGSWKHTGGGLTLSTSGGFPFNTAALQMPELMQQSPLGRPARVVNMSELGQALTVLQNPPVKALFVYNSNPAVVAPNQNAVLEGMRRADLFTVVHEQFFTDTADYADYVLPAPTFLETKDVQGSYGHLFAQVSNRAIEPRGEVWNNVRLFGELGKRIFGDPCFDDREDELIDTALRTDHPWFKGITRERLEREGHVRLELPGPLPFSTAAWFKTPSGRAEVTPVPVFAAPTESRGAASAHEYPLEFLPRKADNYMNSTFVNQPGHQMMEAKNTGVLEVHPVDAQARGIATGDAVEVFNARGRIALKAVVNEQVGVGVVAARLGWNKLSAGAAGLNALTSETLTDLGGGATFYSTLVEVRRAGK